MFQFIEETPSRILLLCNDSKLIPLPVLFPLKQELLIVDNLQLASVESPVVIVAPFAGGVTSLNIDVPGGAYRLTWMLSFYAIG